MLERLPKSLCVKSQDRENLVQGVMNEPMNIRD
jgi:hypothetical protein